MQENKFLKNLTDEKVLNKQRVKNNILSAEKKVKPFTNLHLKKILVPFMLIFIIFSGIFIPAAAIYTEPDISVNYSFAEGPDGYDELYDVINDYNEKQNAFNVTTFWGGVSRSMDGWLEFGTTAEFMSTDDVHIATASSSEDYSETNVQTEGLDEGDIVKTDGQYIYKLSTEGCFIISVNTGILASVSSISIDNYVPKELYVIDNKLVMIGGIYEEYYVPTFSAEPMLDCISYMRYDKTDIRVYNIENIHTPTLDRQITIDGNLNTSRLKFENNKLFYMINYHFYPGTEGTYIPKIKDSEINEGEETFIPAENIYYYDDLINYSYLIIGEIDLSSPNENSKLGAYLGLGGEIYVSSENIYVASYDSYSFYSRNALGWIKETDATPKTRIVKIAINTLTQTAIGSVEGRIDDRYWMDEHEGYLRVATQVQANWSNRHSNIFVLNESLELTGEITNIAEGEDIYSVRFNGENGSLVTFEQVDPYFNLDLSDPENPTISEGLKEDGVSYYLHYIGDTDYTIGIGKMSEVTDNDRVVWTGLKVSLYDNSSGEAVNVNTVVIEGNCYAEILYNPKALLYDEELGLLAFSYELWPDGWTWSWSSMQQGLAVFNFDIDATLDENKLTYRDTLTNIAENGYDYYTHYLDFIDRGLRIGDYIYTVSNNSIKSYTLTDLTLTDELNLTNEIVS